MRFRIQHTTRYEYSQPVFLEPHVVRLRPQSQANQQVESFAIQFDPAPSDLTESIDAAGNTVIEAWFQGLTPSLVIRTDTTAITRRGNPFDYLLHPEAASLPLDYPAALQPLLAPYLAPGTADEVVDRFARDLAQQVDQRTLDFLSQLCDEIYRGHRTVIRDTGDPLPPAETLAAREGSCRDLTLLFLAACRSVGIASRFVSGYQAGDPDQADRHLHAWAEVYLPGGGWRGYDPTHGLAVADDHVIVAAAPGFEGAAPVTGTFRGTGATAQLATRIEMELSAVSG